MVQCQTKKLATRANRRDRATCFHLSVPPFLLCSVIYTQIMPCFRYLATVRFRTSVSVCVEMCFFLAVFFFLFFFLLPQRLDNGALQDTKLSTVFLSFGPAMIGTCKYGQDNLEPYCLLAPRVHRSMDERMVECGTGIGGYRRSFLLPHIDSTSSAS